MAEKQAAFDAWNPGLTSQIPNRLLPLATLYRSENATLSYQQAKEAAEFCGMDASEMASFNLRRLVIHELLIRVTADLSVPDGSTYEVLGLNLRGMVGTLLDRHVAPKMAELEVEFNALRTKASVEMATILDRDIFNPPKEKIKTGLFGKLFGGKPKITPNTELPEATALQNWQIRMDAEQDDFTHACLSSLSAVVGGILRTRGRLVSDPDLVVKFALNHFSNTFGGETVGKLITPIFLDGAKAEGYKLLPVQSEPIFMNVKGSSAAGKSTIRPEQRKLAERLNIPWEDFALISPDYWRKFLLDYDSLGDDYKYAAMLTGQELEIIDKKLDRYMEQKAATKQMTHLLIDRFRFDSFDDVVETRKKGGLISRFGHSIYVFFIITPPAATVERAWERGLSTGRYKAVDDLLFHNIEAYNGIPNLFFSWLAENDRKIHFEILDNSVAFGEPPRTVAFGGNGRMTVLDFEKLNDLDRFKNVNIKAKSPKEVFHGVAKPELSFLKRCVERIPEITFADNETATIYAQIQQGSWEYGDLSNFDKDQIAQFKDMGLTTPKDGTPIAIPVQEEKKFTLGSWANG